MEVVLSPGRFGDEAPGVPFQNEEIREWSHVDRLTGMLERARVETGRWQTSNDQGAARSYGKVIDSRERNSADGSVVQRARRQVEIFQSQGSGRSVQVVRASQWSSSRVTDSTSTKPVTLPDFDRDQKTEKLASLSTLDSRPKSKFHEEAISERLSTLLGSFAYPVSSTVPLRRIDSKYAGRTGILTNSKRSNSNEDVTSLSSRDANLLHRSQPTEVNEENKYSSRTENSERSRMKIAAVNAKREREENIRNKIELSMENEEPIAGFICHEAEVPRSAKSAIHLVPPSKANTTVVNLIKDDSRGKEKGEDLAKRPLVSWVLPSPVTVQETNRTSDLENCHSRRDIKPEDTTTSGITGRSMKRVGFCKTEIHFAADSGKVNIVETDEKPPPTNKFRRRRRLTGITSNKNLPIADPIARSPKNVGQTNESIDVERSVDHDETKPRNDPNLHRGHTTTVNLGCDGLTNGNRVNEEEVKMEGPLEREIDSSSRQASLTMEKHASKVDYNVLCTDAENNQVLLKVVTTHEPTIATVENDHIRKRLNKFTNFEKPSNNEIAKSKQLQLDHTYVNVFTGGQTRVPIYENYKVTESNIKNNKSGKTVKTKEKSSPPDKSSRVPDTKCQSNNSLSTTKPLEDTNMEKLKNGTEENCTDDIDLIGNNDIVHSSVGGKKNRVKTKDNKISLVAKKSSGELSSSNSTNSVITSRLRTSKNIKNPTSTTKTNSPRNQDSVSSCERNLKQSSDTHKARVNKFSPPKPVSTRDVSSTRTKKSDLTKSKVKPMEVVYQTAVYNMKNEKLSKPQKGKESRGPRYLNELICGAKTKRPSDTKNGKISSMTQSAVNNKGASQTVRHWK